MLRIRTSRVEPRNLIRLLSKMNDLLSIDIEVRRVARSTRGKGGGNLSAGDFIVDDTTIEGASGLTLRFADEVGVKASRIPSYDPATAPKLRVPVVGLYCGHGTSSHSLADAHRSLEEMGFNLISLVDSQDLEAALSRIDVLLMPGGDSTEIALSLGSDNASSVRKFVEAGGTYLGICAGSFLGVRNVDGPFGPDHPSFVSCQEILGELRVQLLNDVKVAPGVPMWSYRNFGNALRLYPYEGDLSFRTKKRSDLITLGLPIKFSLRMEGPVFKVKDSADVLVCSEDTVPATTFGVRRAGAESLFVRFDAIVSKKLGTGRYILSSPHIELQGYPEGMVILANSLLSAVSGTLSLSVPSTYQKLDSKQAGLFMASIVDQSDELGRSMRRLSAYMSVLVALVRSSKHPRLWEKIASLSSCLERLSQESQELTRMMVDIIQEQDHLDRLLASISGPVSEGRTADSKTQRLVSLLTRIDQERNSMILTSGRAVPALAMVSLKLEREASELVSKLTKGEEFDVLKEVSVLIQRVAGDRAVFVPWYDAREGFASDDPPSQGVIPPLMGVHAKMRHVLSLSRTARLLSTS